MGIVIINDQIGKKDLVTARQEYPSYIKITADLKQNIVAIGGEYHADAEKILVEQYKSKNNDIWGGGYDLKENKFATDAMLNIKPLLENDSTEILNPQVRNAFLELAKEKLFGIESLV